MLQYKSVFHPRHSILLSIKHSLAQLYGRVEEYNIDELPDVLLERKVELCRLVLKTLDVITPGETRMRGTFSILNAKIHICIYGIYPMVSLTLYCIKKKNFSVPSYLQSVFFRNKRNSMCRFLSRLLTYSRSYSRANSLNSNSSQCKFIISDMGSSHINGFLLSKLTPML